VGVQAVSAEWESGGRHDDYQRDVYARKVSGKASRK
jgi:hypothetical protein